MVKLGVIIAVLLLVFSSFVSAVDFMGANFADDSVTIYENNQRLDIGVGDGPNKIAIKNGLAYVSNTRDNTISIINMNDKQIIKTIKVGKGPIGIEVGDRYAYIINSGSNSVSVIDLSSYIVTSTINIEETPIDAVLRDDGTLLYVTNLGSSSISVINTQDNSVVDTIKDTRLILSPSAIQITPNNDFIYVLNTKNNILVKIDANKYNVRTSYIDLPNVNLNNDLIVGNKYALISSNENGKGKVIIVDLNDNSVINSFDFDKEIYGIDFVGNEFIVSTDDNEIESFVIGEEGSEKYKVGREPRGVKIITEKQNSAKNNNFTLKSKLFWTVLIVLIAGLVFWRRRKRDLEEDYVAIPENKHKKVIPEKKEVKKDTKKIDNKVIKNVNKKEPKKDVKVVKKDVKREKVKEEPKKEVKKENKFKDEPKKEVKVENKVVSKETNKVQNKQEVKTDNKIQKTEEKKEVKEENKQIKEGEPEIDYKYDNKIDEDFY